MRAIDIAPWREMCEEIGATNCILRGDPCGAYSRMDVESRGWDHSVFEPIILYLTGVRFPYEVVITAVGPDNVAGYVRVPKSPDRPETPEPRT